LLLLLLCCCWLWLQIRQAVTEFAILPLGSQMAHERLPHIKSLLLYGAPSTGKTMVAQVGAAWRWAGM
jgi:ATP-dependent 26S proteasome regulatory subunit